MAAAKYTRIKLAIAGTAAASVIAGWSYFSTNTPAAVAQADSFDAGSGATTQTVTSQAPATQKVSAPVARKTRGS